MPSYAHTAHCPSAADQIKAVALTLFAKRGLNAVTVREIAEAAGQKNHASLTYHFGSKDALIREIIIDGARRIDEKRNSWLDACEKDGGPTSVIEILDCLIQTAIDPDPPAGGECYNRFIVGAQLTDRSLFMDALDGRWNSGYQRCLQHIRRLRHDLDPLHLNRRLVFMGSAIAAIMAARETELSDRSREHPMWVADATLRDAAIALAAMIEA